jgi:hypothetical protein
LVKNFQAVVKYADENGLAAAVIAVDDGIKKSFTDRRKRKVEIVNAGQTFEKWLSNCCA